MGRLLGVRDLRFLVHLHVIIALEFECLRDLRRLVIGFRLLVIIYFIIIPKFVGLVLIMGFWRRIFFSNYKIW